jgi:membrane associated rhomboid family serine protease
MLGISQIFSRSLSGTKMCAMFFPIGDDNIKGGYPPTVSYTLIALNILAFVIELQQGNNVNNFLNEYGAVPATILAGERPYTLFTSLFLHAGVMHIFGNMLFLWIFADNIEAIIGNTKFLIFYLLGGLAAHVTHIFFNAGSMIPTVGASGAIAAVMGAYLVMFPRSQIKVLFIVFPFRVSAYIFLGLWIFSQFQNSLGSLASNTAEGSGVAYWAHVGGFIFGIVAGIYFRNNNDFNFAPSEANRFNERDLV